jgi:hypothetical protein
VLRAVVLLEGEPSPQSEVLRALNQVFIQDLKNLCSFPSILTSLPVPVAVKHPYSMMLPPPCFTLGMVSFPPDVMPRIQAKKFNLGFIRPENLVSHGLRAL